MINYLQRIIEAENQDGSQLTRPPNNIEIMNKINEIVNVVNKIELDSTDFGTRKESEVW